MTSDTDDTAFDKLQTAANHRDRADALIDDAIAEIETQLQSQFPFDGSIDVVEHRGDNQFVVEVTPNGFDFDDDTFDDSVHAYVSDPMRIVIAAVGDEGDVHEFDNLKDLISDLESANDPGASVGEVVARATRMGMSENEVQSNLTKLRKQGDIYEPQSGYLRTI